MDTFVSISFGTLLVHLFQGVFTTRSWQSFTYLACGWALTTDRHTITTYMWLSGASTVKHFSRFYAFLGYPLYRQRWHLWGSVIRLADQFVPEGDVIKVLFDDTTNKKSGSHIEGCDHYRNGAGSARQEYRTLRGLNFVMASIRIPLKPWPGHYLSVPVGLELYLKPDQANRLNVPYRSRSQLAHDILSFIALQLPTRQLRSLADGGYATKDYLRQLPDSVHAVGRLPISARLYELPPTPKKRGRGAPRKKGESIGSPKTLAHSAEGWSPHLTEQGAQVQAWCALWHTVMPGRLIRVVVVRRDAKCTDAKCVAERAKAGRRKPVEAFFSTDLSLSTEDVLSEYRERWAIEIDIRDANAFDGLAQDQCRKRQTIIGVNTFRLVMAAARTLWFVDQVQSSAGVNLCRYRPWYRQKRAPSQLDVVWACREALHEAGIFPIPRFIPDLTKNNAKPEIALPLAA